jgi:hypothetical protein
MVKVQINIQVLGVWLGLGFMFTFRLHDYN